MARCERETLYQVLAGLFSILTAFCFPFLTLLFGHVFKEFINYNLAVQISSQNLTTDDYYCRLSENEDIAEYLEFPAKSHQKLHIRIAYLTFLNLAVSMVFFVVAALSRSLSAVAAAQMGKRLRQEYFAALLRKNFGFFEENQMTDLPSTLLLEGIEIMEIGMTCSIVLMHRSVTIVTCLVIGFIVNWRLTLAISFLLPFLMMFIYILVKAISLIAVKEQDALIHASSIAEESLLFIETVKIFEGQQQEMTRYLRQIERANKESRKILVLTALMVGMLYFFILTFFTVGSWFGFHLLLQCQCEASDIILVIAEVVICGFSISELLPAIGEVFAAFQSASLIKRVIKERSKPRGDGMSLNVFEGAIEFSNVTFSYPSAPVDTVLDGISFKVHPRQTLALVGRSGCGKSTIMKLIQRLYEIEDGMIRFDNTDGKYLDLQWLRSQIGLVSKETTLFNAPIADNIANGRDGSTIDETICAAKLANAHCLIADLPYGYASIVGGEESGSVLLNQEQEILICIARALIRNPKILLIDLTGYDFDKEAEEVVLKGINSAREGRTTIIIPNRLSSIAQHAADVIACIDNGRVVEEGNHSHLMERNGLYKSLVMGEIHRDEFSSILTIEDNVAEDVDSNRLIHQQDKYNENHVEGASEDSPLLAKQCGIETADSSKERKTFTLSLYREVLGLVFNRMHWLVLAFSMLFFMLAGATLSSFFILFEKLAEHFNNTSPDEVSRAVEIYSPLYSILGLIVMVLNLIGYTSLCVCEENLNVGIRQKTFSGLMSQRLTWFSNKSVGTLSNMLSTDAAKISQVLSIRVGSIAWSVTAVLGAFSASFILCWPIGITLFPSYTWLLLAGYLHCKLTKRYTDYRKKMLKKGAKMATEAIKRIGTVVPFGMEDIIIRKYSDSLEEPFRCDLKHAAILGVTSGLSQMLVFLFIGFGYLIGTFLILSLSFQFTYSDILTSLFTIWFASQIFKGRFDIMSGLEDGARSSRRVLKYLNKHASAARNPKQQRINLPDKLKYSLQLKNVWNGKPHSSSPVNQSSSPVLSVEAGETLALVGPEFSINNSVLSLVEKIDSPVPNSLLLDGIDISELNSTWLQRQIGVVSRYPILFDLSVADNIRYGVNHKLVSDKDVVDAAKAADVHDILSSLPQSYETMVGFNGYKLTLEQRVGVALARAIIRDPKILFMDDPPNSLEPSIIKALKKATKGRTTVIIANRLSMMQSADSIAVIHNGMVLEQGTHSELMDRKGSYFIMLKQM